MLSTMFSPLNLCSLFILISIVFTEINSQQINGKCTLLNGKEGKCTSVENCANAIKTIKDGGKTARCGFEGYTEIVCCELKEAGEISKQKCSEYISKSNSLKPTGNLVGKKVHTRSLIGSINALPAEFPHVATLGYDDENDIRWACAGSLISEKYVLTAAHCIYTRLWGKVKYVRLGDLDIKVDSDDEKPQNFNVNRIILHPDYKQPSYYNDIALIELSSPIVFDKYVQPACLQTDTNIAESIWHEVGWEVSNNRGEPSSYLQKVALRSYTFEECQPLYSSTPMRILKDGITYQNQLCAGEKNKNICHRNSGPLQVRSEDNPMGHHVLIGIVSFGKSCESSVPTVYTRVSYYIDWIESNVWPQ